MVEPIRYCPSARPAAGATPKTCRFADHHLLGPSGGGGWPRPAVCRRAPAAPATSHADGTAPGPSRRRRGRRSWSDLDAPGGRGELPGGAWPEHSPAGEDHPAGRPGRRPIRIPGRRAGPVPSLDDSLPRPPARLVAAHIAGPSIAGARSRQPSSNVPRAGRNWTRAEAMSFSSIGHELRACRLHLCDADHGPDGRIGAAARTYSTGRPAKRLDVINRNSCGWPEPVRPPPQLLPRSRRAGCDRLGETVDVAGVTAGTWPAVLLSHEQAGHRRTDLPPLRTRPTSTATRNGRR